MDQLRTGSLLLLTALVAGCQAAPQRPLAQYTVDELLQTTSFNGLAIAPSNDTVLIASDASGVFNAVAIPVAGGEPVALTSSTTSAIRPVSYFPGDERFVYQADQEGNELDHVYVQELDGSVTDVTPGERLKAYFLDWRDDGTSFFIASTERDPQVFDIYEVASEGYQRQLVFENTQRFLISDVSPDGRFVALGKVASRTDSDVFLYDRTSGEITDLTPHEGDTVFEAVEFDPTGGRLLLRTDEGSDFKYLVSHDLASGQRTVLVKEPWDVVFAHHSKHGRYLAVAVNADARTEITLYEAATMTPITLPKLGNADISYLEFSDDESLIAFYASSSRSPADLYVQEIGGQPRRLTRALSPAIDPEDLVEGQVVRFASFDGLEIPGILYQPHQVTTQAPGPALVWVHGGPGGQSRLDYSALIQYLVNHGVVVYAINNRGSGGYGSSFEQLDDQAHGEGDLDDCVAAKQMLLDTGWVDPRRVIIGGGSYGGYMTLAALTFHPEAFDGGIDAFGISNWERTVQSIPPWWEAFRKELEKEMGPFDDLAYFHAISPLFHADQIVKPLLVLQGANDPRTLQAESDEIVAAVKANGVPVTYIVFPDEGHGFRKRENRATGYAAMLEFIQRLGNEQQHNEPAA